MAPYESRFVEEFALTTALPPPVKKSGFRHSARLLMSKTLAPVRAVFASKARAVKEAITPSSPSPSAPLRSDLTSASPVILSAPTPSPSPSSSPLRRLPVFLRRADAAEKTRREIEKLAQKELSTLEARKLEDLKAEWLSRISASDNADNVVVRGDQPCAGDAQPSGHNGAIELDGQPCAGDAQQLGHNGIEPSGNDADEVRADIPDPVEAFSPLDDLRRAFERSTRERARRTYQRRGAAMRPEDVVLDTIDELDEEFEWPEDFF
ncbi:hypothetical protein VTO42DRAFT_2305 [Malbranchea cinnamomea]